MNSAARLNALTIKMTRNRSQCGFRATNIPFVQLGLYRCDALAQKAASDKAELECVISAYKVDLLNF